MRLSFPPSRKTGSFFDRSSMSQFLLSFVKNLRLVAALGSVLSMAFMFVMIQGCTKKSQTVEVLLVDGSKAKLPVAETLRVSIVSEPPTLDWNKAADTTSSEVINNIMEGLVQYDLNDKELKLLPALAESWSSSGESKTWTFKLRKDVVWSDGVPFTAQHVVDGWKRLLAKETASEYAYFLFNIKNAQPFNQGKVPFSAVGVKAKGTHELVVELESPMGYFPSLMTHTATYPVRMDLIEKFGDQWTEPRHIATLGPFKLMSWEHDKQIALDRLDTYYGQKPSFKNVVMYMIQENATAISLFDAGKLDAVDTLPSVELRKLRTRKEYRETGILSIYYYGFNTQKAPMDNPLVRKAFAMAIDRQEIVQMLAGGQMPLTSWVPAGMFGYEPEIGLGFNPEKARDLLKEAGYDDLSKFPKVEIRFNTVEDHQRVGENIQAQLKRNLGINVELKNEEWKVYLNSLNTDTPQIYRFGWVADYPDPDNFLAVMSSISDNNKTKWKNAKYDALVKKGASMTDKEERRKIYAQAQKIMVEEDVPVVPLFNSVSHHLVSERVQNYPVNVMTLFIFKGVNLK